MLLLTDNDDDGTDVYPTSFSQKNAEGTQQYVNVLFVHCVFSLYHTHTQTYTHTHTHTQLLDR